MGIKWKVAEIVERKEEGYLFKLYTELEDGTDE